MSNLSDLSKLSKTINEASDKVNEILLDFEKNLVAMNFGVEAWTELASEPYMEGDDLDVQCSKNIELGFGPLEGVCHLLVRTVDLVEEQATYGHVPGWKQRQIGGSTPLLQASREVRVKALDTLEELLGALAAEARRVLKAIETGQKTVDNLNTK